MIVKDYQCASISMVVVYNNGMDQIMNIAEMSFVRMAVLL